jgi:hypothetical protein
MIVKVVYFDEGSATDYLDIYDGGRSEQKTEQIKERTSKLATQADASAEAKFKWLPFLGASAGIATNAEAARVGNTIISKAISNTILTDYLDKDTDKETTSNYIKVFEDCELTPYPESFAFYKMMTPYFIMIDDKVDTGDVILNVSKMDEALESGRGYYELIAEKDKQKCIFRFNIKAFRNNYGIADLVKMNLIYHAIEVGVFPVSKLDMKKEFSQHQEVPSGLDIVDNSKGAESSELLKVYDVILAGVDK